MRLDRERMLLQAFDLLTLKPVYHVRWVGSPHVSGADPIEDGLEWVLDNVEVLGGVWVELSGRPGREDVSQLVAELWWRLNRDTVLSDDPEDRRLPEFIQQWIEETQ